MLVCSFVTAIVAVSQFFKKYKSFAMGAFLAVDLPH